MMELNLSRVDYAQVGITVPKCMKLLSTASKRDTTNKIAVADKNGVLHFLGVKNATASTIFKTLPGTPINRLELGGPVGGTRDKIFISSATDVRGFNKKGKQFMQFNTNLTESIKTMYVEGSDLFVTGNFIYQHYQDLKDSDYLLCTDTINDVICLPMDKVGELMPILACQDRVLRVVKDSTVRYEVEVPGPPSVLALYNNDGGQDGNEILYGTSDGKLGLVQIGSTPIHRWTSTSEKSQAGVTAIDSYDITRDGVLDLLVGRDDGVVEVFVYDEMDEPQLRFHMNCNESITALQGGMVNNSSYHEIICTSYAGWVFGLTSEPQDKALSHAPVPAAAPKNDVTLSADEQQNNARLLSLRAEIEALQQKVFTEREKYQAAANSDKALSAVPLFHVQDKFVLQPDEAAYSLCIECQAPIDNVLVQSDVPVDLLDVEKNSAVVSYSQCNPDEGNFLLATYRCQANTTRLEVKVRSIEGQYGQLQVYVTPRIHPKVCQLKQYPIKPLSLHRRTHNFISDRPLNELRLSGQFSLAEMHSWIAFTLPEVPERVPPEDQIQLTFESTFLGTQLEATYRKGEATFRSDNLSTISILKDVVSKEATNKKVALNISYDINEESVSHTLRLIDPKMTDLLLLAKKVQLIEPLRELAISEQDSAVAFMSEEYQQILAQADELLEQFKRQPCHLERLYGMITDLFIDRYKFKGQNVKGKVPALLECLDNYDLTALVNFFELDSAC